MRIKDNGKTRLVINNNHISTSLGKKNENTELSHRLPKAE